MDMLNKKPLLISAFKLHEAAEYAKEHHLKATDWLFVPMLDAQARKKILEGRHRYQTWQFIGPFSEMEVAYLLS